MMKRHHFLKAYLRMLVSLTSIVLLIGSGLSQAQSTGGALPPIVSFLLDGTDTSRSGVTANLTSLTRVNGVSPETIYFSAQDSTCSDCGDIFTAVSAPGLQAKDPQLATAYSSLAYHFNFDDSDSGNFATTGNSRNQQISGSPRAIHTFDCTGNTDPNWNTQRQLCTFNVGVRVQSYDNRFDDAFIEINIQPLYGEGGYYSDTDIDCVSSSNSFSWCPHSIESQQLTDMPSVGNYGGRLILVDNDGGTYSNICTGADEQHAAIVSMSYIEGAADETRPIIPFVTLAGRPRNCNASYNDSHITRASGSTADLRDNHPQRDAQGNLIDGYGFNQKVVGFRVGNVQNGASFALLQYHDIDMDHSLDGIYSGEFTMSSNPGGCRSNESLDCDNMPYPMFLFLTDSIVSSRPDNLASPVSIGCFNSCAAVNFGLAGVEVNRSLEHNLRIQGAWGLVLSNNWFRGNHVGGQGPKSRVTVRVIDSGNGGERPPVQHNVFRDPENLTQGVDDPQYLRRESGLDDWFNRHNVAISNWINQEVHDEDHSSASMFALPGNYSLEDGNRYFSDPNSDRDQSTLQLGRWRVVRNPIWADETQPDCGFSSAYEDNTNHSESQTIHLPAGSNCNTTNFFVIGLEPLPTPNAPSR